MTYRREDLFQFMVPEVSIHDHLAPPHLWAWLRLNITVHGVRTQSCSLHGRSEVEEDRKCCGWDVLIRGTLLMTYVLQSVPNFYFPLLPNSSLSDKPTNDHPPMTSEPSWANCFPQCSTFENGARNEAINIWSSTVEIFPDSGPACSSHN